MTEKSSIPSKICERYRRRFARLLNFLDFEITLRPLPNKTTSEFHRRIANLTYLHIFFTKLVILLKKRIVVLENTLKHQNVRKFYRRIWKVVKIDVFCWNYDFLTTQIRCPRIITHTRIHNIKKVYMLWNTCYPFFRDRVLPRHRGTRLFLLLMVIRYRPRPSCPSNWTLDSSSRKTSWSW